jgi:hypothetical protein
MKELLVTSGFPRSGNTYLNHALNLLYYPEQEVNSNRHTVAAIEKTNQIIVTLRSPEDSIASWHTYQSGGQLESDIKFYIRFYSAVLDNLSKVVLMDFDYFTKDIDYIKDKVLKNFGIDTGRYVTDVQIKEAMLVSNKKINLPRNNKEELDAVKQQLVDIVGLDQCVELYNQLKLHNPSSLYPTGIWKS